MQLTRPISFLTLAPLLSNALPSGIPLVVSPGINASMSAPPKALNCTDIQDGISPHCYNVLNITAYLENYNTSIMPETCAPPPVQIWSSCFQISAYSTGSSSSPNITTIGQRHNCSTLTTNTSNSEFCTAPSVNEKPWNVDDFYGAFNIWSLQHHISIWAQAITADSSQQAINNVTASDTVADSEAQTATSVLSTLIAKYSVDRDADERLVRLLEAEPDATKVPERPAAPHGRVPSRIDEPVAAAWQPILQARLAEVLALAMGDFDFFLETVRTGAYSTGGLAVVGQLTEAMKRNPS